MNNVNLTISDGDRIGVVGKNGSGKSTFLNMIGGLDIKSPKDRAILKQAGIEDEDMIQDVGMMFRLNLKAQACDPRAIELLSKLRGQFKEQVETTILEPPKPLSPRKAKK
mgnify:CR=1 FL=1